MGPKPDLHEDRGFDHGPGHTALLQPLGSLALRFLERKVEVAASDAERDEDESIDAGLSRGIHQVRLALTIDALERVALLPRLNRRRCRVHRVYAAARGIECGAVGQVPLGELDSLPSQRFDFFGARRLPNERPDGFSGLCEA